MDNIQFEIKEKGEEEVILELTETNKKVSFNNTVQVKTIPNNDQIKQQKQNYNETILLQSIYGSNLEKEKDNQQKILADIKRQNKMQYFMNLEATIRAAKR